MDPWVARLYIRTLTCVLHFDGSRLKSMGLSGFIIAYSKGFELRLVQLVKGVQDSGMAKLVYVLGSATLSMCGRFRYAFSRAANV